VDFYDFVYDNTSRGSTIREFCVDVMLMIGSKSRDGPESEWYNQGYPKEHLEELSLAALTACGGFRSYVDPAWISSGSRSRLDRCKYHLHGKNISLGS